MPVVTPPEQWSVFCGNEDEPGVSYGDRTVTVPAIPEMKYHQQDYWGSDVWETSWARRTYVEGAFGNLKNHHTGNIKRGFMTAHGIPLVSLALTAAVVAHNMRELESWCRAARKHDPKNPLLALYESHPLHQESEHIYGHEMLTKDERDRRDRAHLAAAA